LRSLKLTRTRGLFILTNRRGLGRKFVFLEKPVVLIFTRCGYNRMDRHSIDIESGKAGDTELCL
jgi:hypothetical protein